MRLALSIIGSPFRLPLIAAHFPKLARPFNETPLSVLSLFCRSRWIADFVDPPAGRAAQLRMPRFVGNRGIHGQGKGGDTLSVGRILQAEMLRVNRPDGLSLNGA